MERKEIILEAAIALFAEQGYDGTPTKAIAERAGVSEGLIFRHYTNKEGLLKAIIAKGMVQVAETLKPLAELGEKDNAVNLHLKLTVETLKQNTQLWQLLHSIRLNKKVRAVLMADIEQSNTYITTLLKSYFKRIGRKNPAAEAQLYFAIVDGITLQYLENPEGYALTEVINQLKTHYK